MKNVCLRIYYIQFLGTDIVTTTVKRLLVQSNKRKLRLCLLCREIYLKISGR